MVDSSVKDLFGKVYPDGAVIFRENDPGDMMYVIQEGEVEISAEINGKRTLFCTLRKGDYFGEMALLDNFPRLATATVKGSARIMPLTKETLKDRIEQDPHMALSLLKNMCYRIRALQESLEELKAKGHISPEHLCAAVRTVQSH